MITLTKEEAQQVLEHLDDLTDFQQWEVDMHATQYGEGYKPHRMKHMKEQLANTNSTIETLRARLSAPEPEPGFEVKFEQVADGIEVGYDLWGGVDIRLGGEFVYVHINYDHRYTYNSARKELADKIVGLLTGSTAPPQRECEFCGKVAKP